MRTTLIILIFEVSVSNSSFIPGMQDPGLGTRDADKADDHLSLSLGTGICNGKLKYHTLNSSRLVEHRDARVPCIAES